MRARVTAQKPSRESPALKIDTKTKGVSIEKKKDAG
jgi:hypothetical protein